MPSVAIDRAASAFAVPLTSTGKPPPIELPEELAVLSTLKSAVAAGTPALPSFAVTRIRTAEFNVASPAPSAKEFQTKPWTVPPGAAVRPFSGPLPGPGVAVAYVAPPFSEYSTTTEQASPSASLSVNAIGILPPEMPPGVTTDADGGVNGRLLTSKAPLRPAAPAEPSFGVMRNFTLTFTSPVATPLPEEFQAKRWLVPPGEDPRPATPSPPLPAIAGLKVAPPSIEYSATIAQASLSASVSVYEIAMVPVCRPAGVITLTEGGVNGRLLTVNAPDVAGVPEPGSDGVTRNFTLVGITPVAMPSATLSQTNVWTLPPPVEDARPETPSPPAPALAGRNVAPPLIE